MNLTEGTRRLALFLGVAGAIFGGFASYLVVQDVVRASERHQAFDRLAASDTVRQARNSWTLTLVYTPEQAIETLRHLPEDRQRDVIGSLTHEERVDLAAKLKCEPASDARPTKALSQVDPFADYGQAKDDPFACLAEASDPPTSTVNNAGIKTIRWTKDLQAESIETADGRTLYPAPPPNRWLYLLAAFLPFLGFLIPWGAVRSVGWVGAGFVASSK